MLNEQKPVAAEPTYQGTWDDVLGVIGVFTFCTLGWWLVCLVN